MRGNAWLVETSKFDERRFLIAWKCAELRLPVAWKCAALRPANAWKCAEPRLAWECELRGCLRTAARVRGTRMGSAREVRLKCGSSAWNCGSTHWWVPYLYGTGTLRARTLPLTPFIAVAQLVIQLCNAFLKFYCYPIILKYIFLAFGDDADHFLLIYHHK